MRTQLDIRSRLENVPRAVKWTRPEGIHITLQFLGDVPETQLPFIQEALFDACSNHRRFTLNVGVPGAFPNSYKPRVLWVDLEGEISALKDLQHSVEQNLGRVGYKADKPFSPHMTLGRIRQGARREEIDAVAAALATSSHRRSEERNIQVTHVSLMRSKLGAGGAVYSQLFWVELK